jgi:hypothetical protein
MAQDDDEGLAVGPDLVDTCLDERLSYALPLEPGKDGNGRKAQAVQGPAFPFNDSGAESASWGLPKACSFTLRTAGWSSGISLRMMMFLCIRLFSIGGMVGREGSRRDQRIFSSESLPLRMFRSSLP